MSEHEAPFTSIGIGTHDLEAFCLGVLLDCGRLVLQRVLLMFGGHAKVLSGGNKVGNHGALLKEDIGRTRKIFSERIARLNPPSAGTSSTCGRYTGS